MMLFDFKLAALLLYFQERKVKGVFYNSRLAKYFNDSSTRVVMLNIIWLLFEKLGVLALSLFTSILVARHLGANDFGSLSYALAIFGMFSPLTYLGLNSIVIRDLIKRPEQHDVLMGSAFALKFLGSLILVVLFAFTSSFFIEDKDVINIVIVLSVSSVFESFGVVGFWYLSQSKSKYFALSSILSVFLSSLIKILFVFLDKPLIWFGYATASQVVISSVALLVFYKYHRGGFLSWRAHYNFSINLILQSWPLALSAVFSLIYLKVDQVMLGQMISSSEVGLYSAAARLSEVWYVLPTALATAVFPTIVKKREQNKKDYLVTLEKLYRSALLMSFIIVIPVFFVAESVIYLLYGEEFEAAGSILAIHIWACPAMFMGAIYSKVLISEGLLKHSLFRDIAGAILNIILNFYLIPLYGGKGAAIATVVAYTFSSYLMSFMFSKTRHSGILMTKAILYPFYMVGFVFKKLK